MAKKNVKINNQPLTPTVLAKVKNVGFNPIYLILLFLVFGVVVYFLPDMSLFIDKRIHPEKYQEVQEVVNDNRKKYYYNEGLEIDVDGYKLKNINISITKISFTVMNIDSDNDLSTTLELYNAKDKLLEEKPFYLGIMKGATEEMSLDLDLKSEKVAYFKIKEKE